MNAPLALFVIFSGLATNLTLQCGLGISADVAEKKQDRIKTLLKLGIIFTAVILLWVLFAKILSSIISGMFIYVLLFPISLMVYDGLEFLTFRYLLKKDTEDGCSVDGCSVNFPGGITSAALFICLSVADSFIEAAALSFGFAAGVLLAFFILGEIRRRAALEAVPRFLRGKPLILISMGLLSLIFTSVSLLLFRILEG